jgi:peptidoglycan/xylan/chitin deacetylase (PgdA/CDA1 family)
VTPQVLDRLKRRQLQTTFFVIGSRASKPEGVPLMQRAIAEGHSIGAHTFSHTKPLGKMPAVEAVREFNMTEEAITAAGVDRRLFRPYGGGGKIGKHLMQRGVLDLLVERRYTCVLWNSVPGDWRDPEGWLGRAVSDIATRDWSLVVLHDINAAAMGHLDAFLDHLAGDGYEWRQDFPPDCTPIVDGRIVRPTDDLVSD